MAEIAVAALALTAPPCVIALAKIAKNTTPWEKIIGTLRISSRARETVISSQIPRTIHKIREELKKNRAVLPADQVKDFVDKLSRKISLYNKLITKHSVADPKERMKALLSVKKSLMSLLQDIKDLARKCANEDMLHDMKSCLYCDENVTYPDSTIAAYDRDSVQPQPLPTMGTTETVPGVTGATDVVSLPPSASPPQSRTHPNTPSGIRSMSLSYQQLNVPINLVFTFTAPGNSPAVPESHHTEGFQQS
ncbi:hypothetical protein DL96DRAFT_727182 [Flagelloscypha sp. PMI_526]|nr:hypothetical protein DL96DRAFT_727182 [Flagelloscypha sp. PMI_526]